MILNDFLKLKYTDIISSVNLNKEKNSDLSKLNIAFLRNITLDPIMPFIKYFGYKLGYNIDIYMGEYDNAIQEVLNSSSELFKFNPDIIIIALKLDLLSEKLLMNFVGMDQTDIQEEINRITSFYNTLINEIRNKTDAIILVHSFEIPGFPIFGILDYQDSNKQVNTIKKINELILNEVKINKNVFLIDIELLKATIGFKNFLDLRYWYMNRAPYSMEAFKIISYEYFKFIKAFKGKTKKCLILDCDNTLWGGIIGEDGLINIQIGTTYPGNAFLDFQKIIKNLSNRGILLAICSKNNEEDVKKVFNEHPEMILKESDFVSLKINWEDKVNNIKEIAKELNIGIDSFVFVDDNEFEINMVKELLPEVTTIHLPKEPSEYPDILLSSGLFDTLTFSDEDKNRSNMYKAEVKRKKSKKTYSSIEDYLKSLEMEVFINEVDDFSIPRVSQLTQRTNQFNLTTQRYLESDIKNFMTSNKYAVFYLRLKDKFGDYGIVGAFILKFEDNCLIDTFLMSCRIIGRGVEEIMLKFCIDYAKEKGFNKIFGKYIPTSKNSMVNDFYIKHGFSKLSTKKNINDFVYSFENKTFDTKKYFKNIEIKNKK